MRDGFTVGLCNLFAGSLRDHFSLCDPAALRSVRSVSSVCFLSVRKTPNRTCYHTGLPLSLLLPPMLMYGKSSAVFPQQTQQELSLLCFLTTFHHLCQHARSASVTWKNGDNDLSLYSSRLWFISFIFVTFKSGNIYSQWIKVTQACLMSWGCSSAAHVYIFCNSLTFTSKNTVKEATLRWKFPHHKLIIAATVTFKVRWSENIVYRRI